MQFMDFSSILYSVEYETKCLKFFSFSFLHPFFDSIFLASGLQIIL